MTTHPTLTLSDLSRAVTGEAVAIRAITKLHPAGGPGDKVFPPTYLKERRAETKYAFEVRKIGGEDVKTVLLDSVASQANRFEEALLEGWRRGDLPIPIVQVDFSGQEGLEDLEQITSLQAPHRIADAILRDSLLDGQPFRQSAIGRAFTEARVNNATGMHRFCPTALVFGVWDSTGPKGGLGAKFQRALVSEIVGIGAQEGVKTASRLDPTGIQRTDVFQKKGDPTDWTVNEGEAETKKKKPVPFSRKGAKGKGTPAAVNHGNIPPTIDTEAGGVTIDHAVQTTVLSLPALRRLRFQENVDGERIPPGESRDAAEHAARVALAALALAAVAYGREQGYDLRSRSLLVPEGPLVLEVLPANGGEAKQFGLDREAAAGLLREAAEAASALGLGWSPEPITLQPMPKLVELIRRSRDLSARGEADEADE